MGKIIYFIVLLAISVYADDDDDDDHHHHSHHHHHDCEGKDCDLIKEAISHIGMRFDRHLCHAFKHVHCKHHVLSHDENVCGSDGRTYHNHCLFAQARCKVILDDDNYHNHRLIHPLKIVRHGACVHTTVPKSTASTSGSKTTAAIGATRTHTVVTTLRTVATTTTRPTTTSVIPTTATITTRPTTTTTTMTASPTTTMSIHYLIGSVFCQYKGYVNCPTTLNVVCGSNGNFFPNTCELLKYQCDDPTLREVTDSSKCALSP